MGHTFESPAAAGDAFIQWVRRTKFSDATQAVYIGKVRIFTTWLEAAGADYDGALTDPHVRDYAVRDFRRELMTGPQKAAVATVENYVSAIGAFYDYLGLGKPDVRRAKRRPTLPKSLTDDQLLQSMRAAERRGVRDFAIAATLFGTGVRVSELVAVDTDDLFMSDRLGALEVRHGKGGEARTVPVPADSRAALRKWLAERRHLGFPDLGPLFTSRHGRRISVRRVQSLTTSMGEAAGVELTPHVFRHTFARKYLEGGGDVGGLQQILGHASLATTGIYTRAPASVLAEQSERVRIDL